VRQGQFLKRCGRLLLDGFSLQDALRFLETIVDDESNRMIRIIYREVSQGLLFSDALKAAGFPDVICAQLYFSLYHGHLAETTLQAGHQLLKQADRKKKLMALLQYPLVLLCFVMMMLLAMRYILLPHMSDLTSMQTTELDFGTRFILGAVYHAPIIFLTGSVLLAAGLLAAFHKARRLSPVARLKWTAGWSKSSLFRLYWTRFFSNEWGGLLKGNTSLFEVVAIMKQNGLSPLITEMGELIESEMKQGHAFHETLKEMNFLNQELTLVIRQGEQSGRLGQELEMYAENCEEEFDKNVERVMNWIQPVIFIFVAVIIVAIYAALLLPTFSAMQTF